MSLSRPVTELTFDDIQVLVDNQEPESVTLEYKREIDTSARGKKELAKDVSAMANSQGGLLIIGLDEQDHRPKIPDHFVGRMLGQQKVEEWLDQVLNSNVQQRVNVRIKPVPVPGKPGKCVVVVHVPPSPSVPHMVTAQNDNRYYVRHNCEVLPAEEYEIRDMFERGRRMRGEVEQYLRKHGFFEPDDDANFCGNKLTRRLGMAYFDETSQPVVEPAHTTVAFVGCPTVLQDRIDTASDEFRRWLDPTKRHYFPPAMFIPHQSSRRTLGGIIRWNSLPRVEGAQVGFIREYLAVHRTEYVEYGYGDGVLWKGHRILNFIKVAGRFWQFLGFLRDLYDETNLTSTAVVLLNMANVGEAYLDGFGHGWRHISSPIPREFGTEACLDTHIQLEEEMDIAALNDDQIEKTVRKLASRIGSAFEQDRPRCFNEADGSFPEDLFRGYVE
jgi:hypothetical protein